MLAPPPPPPQATGVVRVLFVAAGLVNVGLAYVGWLLPGVPMTPFVFAASYCFARSSPRLQGWLLRSPFFGQLLTDWHRHRGMRRRAKVTAGLMLTTACTVSVVFAPVPPWVRVAIAGSAVVGLTVIFLAVPTVRPD